MPHDAAPDAPPAATSPSPSRTSRWPPPLSVWLPLAAVTFVTLTLLVGELVPATNGNQSGVHEAVVRWVLQQWRGGHLPLDGWFAPLSGGLPQFHHAESVPHLLVSLPGLVLGGDLAYRLALWLLLGTWPLALWAAARLAGLDRRVALAAALLAPLPVSVWGSGQELGAYVWAGRGLFAQLVGVWLLPFAWALTWRALRGRASPVLAGVVVAGAFVCDLRLWPILLLGIVVVALHRLSGLAWQAARAAVVVGVAGVASAWVWAPIVASLPWADRSTYLVLEAARSAPGIGAGLWRLFTGEWYDAGRVPVLTALVAVGVVVVARRVRFDGGARVLLALWVGSLLWASWWPAAQPLFGSLADGTGTSPPQTPAAAHVAGLVLAAIGAAALWGVLRRVLQRRLATGAAVAAALALLAAVAVAPAAIERAVTAWDSGTLARRQHAADTLAGPALDQLVLASREAGPGRIWGGGTAAAGVGAPGVGLVTLGDALLARDTELFGLPLRTASLLSDPEALLAPDSPQGLQLVGVRYLLLPEDVAPSIPVTELARAGAFVLWQMDPATVPVQTYDGVGPPIAASRDDIGTATKGWDGGSLAADRVRPMAYDGAEAGPVTLGATEQVAGGPPGAVTAVTGATAQGAVGADVDMRRSGYVVLKVSAHGGWTASVDGDVVDVRVLSPSLIGVEVFPGAHTVTFASRPWAPAPWLLLAAVAVVVAAAVGDRRFRTRS